MTAHAKLGPSNKRWPHCPGSIREEAQYQDVAGAAAIDGTGSHLLLELCLDDSVKAESYLGKLIGVNHHDKPNGWMIDQERCDRVQECLNYVYRRNDELLKEYPDCSIQIVAETKSDPGKCFGREDWWGTVDITIIAFNPETMVIYFIEVVDYKDGRGYVSEKNNSQLVSYLFGKLHEYTSGKYHMANDNGLRMTIVQPKTNPSVRYQDTTVFDISKRANGLATAAAATDDPNAPLFGGSHCQWCKANPKRGGHCTVQTQKSVTIMNNLITMPDQDGIIGVMMSAVNNVGSLSVKQLTEIADAEDGFKAAFDKVRTEIQERISIGENVPGYALVPGKMSKVWNEPDDEIVKKLKARRMKKDEIFPSKLITPAQVLKHPKLTDIQKKKIMEDLISEVAGKSVLKKVTYTQEKDASEMFANVAKPEVSFL